MHELKLPFEIENECEIIPRVLVFTRRARAGGISTILDLLAGLTCRKRATCARVERAADKLCAHRN